MSGANPQITATVSTVDHATGPLQNIAELSKRITREANSALAGTAAEMQRGLAASHNAFAASAQQQTSLFRASMADMKLVGTEVATHLARTFSESMKKISADSVDVGETIEKQLLKIKAFTSASPADIDNILKSGARQGASLPGGLRSNIEAARAAAMSGVKPSSAAIAATHGQMFAYETGQDAATATEDLVSHAAMLGHVKDDRGRSIPISSATAAQIERGLTETQNLLIAINKLAPGNLHDVYEGFKYGAPSNMSAKVTSGQLGAEYIQLAEKGIRAQPAGVAATAGIAALAAPTAKARMAAASLGVDIDKYRSIDYSQLQPDNVVAGVASRIGREKAEGIRGGAEHAISAFKLDGNARKLNDTLVSLIQHSGAKTLTDHVRAANMERDVIAPLVSKADFPGFIKALNEAKAGIGAFNQIFGTRQGGKLIVLDGARLASDAKFLEAAEHGDNYARSVAEYRDSYLGRKQAAAGAKEVAEQGIFEAEKPLREKAFGFQKAIADLAAQHPVISAFAVEGGKYGAGAAAAVGGIAVQLQILKYLKGMSTAASTAATAAAPTAGIVARGATMGAAADLLGTVGLLAAWQAQGDTMKFSGERTEAMKKAMREYPENYKLRSILGMDGPSTDASLAPAGRLVGLRAASKSNMADSLDRLHISPISGGSSGGGLAAAIDGLRSSLAGSHDVKVQGDVRGEATLMQTIRIDPSPLLIATVASAQNIKMGLAGKLGQTMRGSNAAMPSVATGLSTFKPTVSGH